MHHSNYVFLKLLCQEAAELPRIPIPRTPVNKGMGGRGVATSTSCLTTWARSKEGVLASQTGCCWVVPPLAAFGAIMRQLGLGP
jgi:hypothetical protein